MFNRTLTAREVDDGGYSSNLQVFGNAVRDNDRGHQADDFVAQCWLTL